MDIILLLRAAYLSAAALVLVVFALPVLRSRFLDYGPRSSTSPEQKESEEDSNTGNVFTMLLDKLAAVRVPHSWFTSFYIVSSALSFVWLFQLARRGALFTVVVAWALMSFQGSRRLYECLTVSKPSRSEMWFGHWALGILFYALTSVAIWTEGVPSIRNYTFESSADSLDSMATGLSVFSVLNLSAKTFVGLLIFVLGTGLQADCHAYLAALRAGKVPGLAESNYHFPQHPAFNLSLTPHYFAECVIYVGIAIAAAPEGRCLNWTMVSALVFVTINLGVTAHGTKQWYRRMFGADAVEGRAKMIPFIF